VADATLTEDEAARAAQEQQAETARHQARREADRLARAQADRLAEQPDEMRDEAQRLRSRQQQIADYHAEQRRVAEEALRKRRAEQEAEAKEAEIRDAQGCYAEAYAGYDIRDPYGSLSHASMEEWRAFRRERHELDRQIAAETDPDKRRTLALRRDIELCDYMSITSHRIAGQSEVIVGRSDTEEAVRQRAQAKAYEERARELRAQYREHVAAQQLSQETETGQETDWEVAAAEQTDEPPQPTRPSPQRGQRTSRGRTDREKTTDAKAGDAERDDRLRERGERTERVREETSQSQRRGSTLER
jgi:hypothetical protein